MPLSPISITNLESIPETAFGPATVTNLESAGNLFAVDVETLLKIKTDPFYAIRKAPRSRKLRKVKLKNICNDTLFLYKIASSKAFSRQPKVIKLSPKQTIEIILEAYDSLRIEELQKRFKLQVTQL